MPRGQFHKHFMAKFFKDSFAGHSANAQTGLLYITFNLTYEMTHQHKC